MASEPKKHAQGYARVQLTIELDAGSSWGDDCTLGQVFDQAARETIERLRSKLHPTNISIIGEPVISAFIVKRE